MAALVAAIHALLQMKKEEKAWMPGTRPGTTNPSAVMAALVAAIHVFSLTASKTWMAEKVRP